MKEEDINLIKMARKLVYTNAERYLKYDNINSIGIGYRIKDNKQTSELCIQFTVTKKLDNKIIEAQKGTNIFVPGELELSSFKLGTDIVERTFNSQHNIPDIENNVPRKERHDNIFPGISIGQRDLSTGTIGAIVFHNQTGQPYALGNWHVLHRRSQREPNEPIYQPGLQDFPVGQNNKIGILADSYIGFWGDCAIASIDPHLRGYRTVIAGLSVSPKKTERVRFWDRVIKSGKESAVTNGIVNRPFTIARIVQNGVIHLVLGFEIRIDPLHKPPGGEISVEGDSGACWMLADANGSSTETMVGMNMTGELTDRQKEYAIACHIDFVLKKLNVSLIPPQAPPSIL